MSSRTRYAEIDVNEALEEIFTSAADGRAQINLTVERKLQNAFR